MTPINNAEDINNIKRETALGIPLASFFYTISKRYGKLHNKLEML